jgi:hypothetical protein
VLERAEIGTTSVPELAAQVRSLLDGNDASGEKAPG